MEQDNLLSCTPQSSVSENREYVNYYHQIPSTSSSTDYYHDPNYMKEEYLPSLSSYQHTASGYQQPQCNSETNYVEPFQASASYEEASHEAAAHEDASHEDTSHEDTSHENAPHEDAVNDEDENAAFEDEDADENAAYEDENAAYEEEDKDAAYEDAVHDDAAHEVAVYEDAEYDDVVYERTSYLCTCDSDDSSDSNEPEDSELLIEILHELFEEIIIEHCFEIHQAKKLGAFIFDEAVEETSQEQREALMSSSVTCPNCFNKHELKDYKVKLGECMRLTTRKSKRTATRAQPNFAETAIDNLPSNGQSKSKKRKKTTQKSTSKNAKVRLQQDDGDIYSKEACGHVTKSGNRCTKKGNCPTHKPQTKSTMPMLDFSYRPPPSYQDEYHIDVDTVEETTPYPSFSNYSLPDYSNSEYTMLRKEENGKIKMILNRSDPQKKKKKKKSKHDPYPGPI